LAHSCNQVDSGPIQTWKPFATIYDELERHPLQADTGGDTLIVIGYHLHNLYNAFENIFQNVAVVFENSTDDVAQWHTQLVMGKALALKSIYVHQLFQLMSFLQNLAKPT
jgi:hypothetical protein